VVFIFLFLLLVFLYSVLTFYFIIGLTKIKIKSIAALSEPPFISVVVACRNEEKNIKHLYESLEKQNYPPDKFEILLVNDHSTDHTIDILKTLSNKNKRIRLLHLVNEKKGKKAALRMGIEHALSEIVATTDADCIVPENWLASIAPYFKDTKLKLLIGPVKMDGTSFFEKLQALEFSGLIGSGAGATIMKLPFLSNGANLSFRKKDFLQANLKPDHISGDDIFLLQQIKKKHSADGIKFLAHPSGIVTTQPQKTWIDFLNQRIRWLSKSSGYTDFQTIAFGLLIFLTHLFTLIIGITLFFKISFLYYFIIGFGIKFLIEFTLLFFSTRFLNQKRLLIDAFPLAIGYPIYVFFVSLLTLLKTPEWKDRKY